MEESKSTPYHMFSTVTPSTGGADSIIKSVCTSDTPYAAIRGLKVDTVGVQDVETMCRWVRVPRCGHGKTPVCVRHILKFLEKRVQPGDTATGIMLLKLAYDPCTSGHTEVLLKAAQKCVGEDAVLDEFACHVLGNVAVFEDFWAACCSYKGNPDVWRIVTQVRDALYTGAVRCAGGPPTAFRTFLNTTGRDLYGKLRAMDLVAVMMFTRPDLCTDKLCEDVEDWMLETKGVYMYEPLLAAALSAATTAEPPCKQHTPADVIDLT